MVQRRRARRRTYRRRRPRRRVFRARRYRRFVSKRNRARRRRNMALKPTYTSITGLDSPAFFNRLHGGLSDTDYATFNIYPFPVNPYGGMTNSGPHGTFIYGAQVNLLNSTLANAYSPVLPSILEGHDNLVTASSEVTKFADLFEQFRIVSVELTFMQNKRPGSGNTDAGVSTGYENNCYILYNYLESVGPQDIKSYFGSFLTEPTQSKVNAALPWAYFQNWNDIACVSMESNRSVARSGWHRKLLTPNKPVKLFYRPKHYPIGGSNALWIPTGLYDNTQKIISWPNPPQSTKMTGGWVSCDYIRKIADPALNLLWTGPAILLVDTSTAQSGTYSVGPLGGSNNIFQHVFGITCRYHIKLAFRGLRKDRYQPAADGITGELTSEPAEWEKSEFTQRFEFQSFCVCYKHYNNNYFPSYLRTFGQYYRQS